ncbi:hypothetical protein O3P69_009799 [Scylla paramamosain]|uniref:Acyl-CoA dehydrogenase/oxidase C-terminal domain-containing protein n=1 Tax=Scylla paramamosain TaxID=85552 RepID=A0AAW0SMP1_SCYPA
MSSKAKCLDEETVQLLKFASWATSAGQADWYVIQTVNPGFAGDYSDFSCFLVFKNEVRANTEDWSALGMHGNISGPIVIEGKFNIDRMIGSRGEGKRSNDETIIPYHLLFTSACWIGISLASIDVAKKHVTHKAHANVGMRVCDYPSVQDLFGEAVCDVNSVRCQGILLADAMDKETNNNDWRLHEDKAFVARQVVSDVTDKMLHACGGTGYKTHLGIERLLRDGKAGWVIGALQ